MTEDVTVDAANVYLTDGAIAVGSGTTITYTAVSNSSSVTGTRYVKISTEKLEESYDNKVIQLTMPISAGNRTSKAPSTRIYDFKMITHTISFSGYLEDESTDTLLNKKKNLLILAGASSDIKRGGVIALVWGQGLTKYQQYAAIIQKLKIGEEPGIITDTPSNPTIKRHMPVTITLLVGTNLG